MLAQSQPGRQRYARQQMSHTEVKKQLSGVLAEAGIPGTVASWGSSAGPTSSLAYGVIQEDGPAVETSTRFDLASLTKVVATLPALLRLISDGELGLDRPLSLYFSNAGSGQTPSLADVTVRELLAHNAGLPAFSRVHTVTRDRLVALAGTLQTALDRPPGSGAVYSDVGFMLLGALVERVSGQRLDRFAQEHVFRPLGMDQTHFNPLDKQPEPAAYAATEYCGWRNRLLQGEVHDENCFAWEGVSGHAGLFGTAHDLALYCRAWLQHDERLGRPELLLETQRLHATTAGGEQRGLGWVLAPAGFAAGRAGYGHTGFTGTSLWLDPTADRFAVLLTNRVHPHRQRISNMNQVRASYHELVL